MVLMLCVALTAVSQVSAEDTDNITLTTTDEIIQEDISSENIKESVDELLSDDGDDYKSFDEVQQKINNARAGSTLYIEGKYKGTGQEITIDKPLTIVGGSATENYTTFNADGQSRIFYITSPKVLLKNLALVNGYTSYDGGAVYGGAVEGCAIGYCEADGNGGALYDTDVTNSVFLKNSANRGGAIYLSDGTHSIKTSYFANNSASDGGAVYFYRGSSEISQCEFEENYASYDGGAVYAYYSGLAIHNTDFKNNEAGDDGGAVYSDDVVTEVHNCYFWSNEADDYGGAMYECDAFDSAIYLNKASTGGGMAYGNAYDCVFSLNTPENVYGTNVYQSIKGKITLSQAGSYFGDKTVSAKVINVNNNNPVSGAEVTFKFSNGKSATVYTGSNGVATYKVPFNPGTYKVTAYLPSDIGGASAALANIKIAKAPAAISPVKLNTKFQADKYFKVKVINSKTKKGIAGVKLQLKVFTGKKAKKVTVTTASNGVASYNAAKLKVGNHKVKVSIASSQVSAKAKTSKITVKKASTSIDKYDALYYYKDVKKGVYYIGVYNKDAHKFIKGVKVKVKVFTGKKSKTYTLKTKKDGFAVMKVKGIKIGKHKVQITFNGNKNFKKSTAKATIEVSKKMPTRIGYYSIMTFYSYGWVSGRSISVYLKDMNGKELRKKVTLISSGGDKTTGYSGDSISMPDVYSGGSLTLKFAGDRKYMPSTYTIRFT